jgi:hypothetical protein
MFQLLHFSGRLVFRQKCTKSGTSLIVAAPGAGRMRRRSAILSTAYPAVYLDRFTLRGDWPA